MKPKHVFFLFSILIFCSCHKDQTDEEIFRRNLPGNYDWSYSSEGKNGSSYNPLVTITPNIDGNNYGLTILKNDKAFLYKNGKQIKKGKLKNIEKKYITSASGYSTYVYYNLTFEFDGETYLFDSKSGELNSQMWPYVNYNNNFQAL